MIPQLQQQILNELHSVCELSPDVRFGQMIANLAFLAEDAGDNSIWDIDDQNLLRIIVEHRSDLCRRQSDAVTTKCE